MAYNRGVMIVVVMGMALFSSLIFSAVAQPSAHVDLDYGETKFLVTQLEDDFCGAVPNPSSMKLLSVSDWNKLVGHDCDQNKFAGYVLLSVVASFVFVVLALFFGFCVFPCACLMRYRFGFFGGSRRTPVNGLKGTVLPNNELDPHPGYSSYSIVATKASLGLLFLVVLAGGAIVIAGATMISHFIWQAQAIFESYPAYHLATTYSLFQTLPNLPYTDDPTSQAIAFANYGLAKELQKTGEDEITDRLSVLNNVVQAAFYLLVAAAFLLVLLGIYAAVFKLGRFSLILSLVLVLLFAAVWAEFSFVYGANNVIDKMCVAIDRCHFCYTGQWPSDNTGSNYHCGSQYCKTPWFDAMKFCQPETSARYSTLEELIEGGISSAVNATCLQIQDICTSPDVTQCVYPNGPCNSTDLIGVGLAGIVTVQLKASGSFESINAIANNQAVNESLRAAANEAVTQAGFVTQYGGLLQQAQSLDCNSQFAFIEGVPDGTYDRLQKHLCPASPDDDIYHQRSLQTILPITAGGLLLIGVALPFIQVLLCLGEKRFAKRAKKQFGGLEDENLVEGIINNGWGMK